jgi:hypothetical protein
VPDDARICCWRDMITYALYMIYHRRSRAFKRGHVETIAEKIFAKLSDGLLPSRAPTKSCGEHGSGHPCDGCGAPIVSTEVEHEIEFDHLPPLRLHAMCEAIWQALRSRVGSQSVEPPERGALGRVP